MGVLDGLIDAGDIVDTVLWELVNAALTDAAAAGSGADRTDIPNGNMEIDVGATGIPDFWTDDGTSAPIYGGHGDVYPGGSIAFETTSPLAGSQSIKMVHPGGASNGGGLLESDFFPCGHRTNMVLSWLHKASAAGMKNQVIIYWYDKAQVALGSPSTTVYSSTTNPTTAWQFARFIEIPSTAKFFTIGLVGGFTDTDVAGTAYFDEVHIKFLPVRNRTFSAAASTSFNEILATHRIEITLNNITTSGSPNLVLEVSSDGGSTWVTSAIYASDAFNTTDTADETSYTLDTTTASAERSGTINIIGLGTAGRTVIKSSMTAYTAAGAIFTNQTRSGGVNSATVYDAIRIKPSTGTFSGEITLEEKF
jgi:hypothetical protein